MNEALVSIIIPIYKTEKLLSECIESIIAQSYRNLEVILVDDGSPDLSPKICDEWAEKDHRITVIHKKNGGVSSARNAGIDSSSGEWIIFIDSDDIIAEDTVECLVESIQGNDKAVSGVLFSHNREEIHNSKNLDIEKLSKKAYLDRRGGSFCVANLWSRNIIEKNNIRFDEKINNLEDYVWVAEYFIQISECILIDEPKYFYYQNPESITSQCVDFKWQAGSWVKAYESLLTYMRKKHFNISQFIEFRKYLRRCINNFHAECYVGNASASDAYAIWRIITNDRFYSNVLLSAIDRLRFNCEFYLYHILFGLVRLTKGIRTLCQIR